MSFSPSDEIYIPDLYIVDSLDSDASKGMFYALSKNKPTLGEALKATGLKNHNKILDSSSIFIKNLRKNKPEIFESGLSVDDASAIACYTYQGGKGEKTLYSLINESLAGGRNRETLGSTRNFFFLLLSALRKLRPYNDSKYVYRGIRAKVPQTKDEATQTDESGVVVTHQYYEEGKIVTWWGLTSTSIKLETAKKFIKGASGSTLFHIGGEGLWGYDIHDFSFFEREKEVLLEPEAKVSVNKLEGLGNSLTIKVDFQPFSRLVLEDIIPVGGVETVPPMVGTVEYYGSSDSLSAPKGETFQEIEQQKKVTEEKWRCAWKECPDDVSDDMKYVINGKNIRVAKKVNDGNWCTIIGDTTIPPNTITSWSIKILRSWNNAGDEINIGVAPFDINQNGLHNRNNCGWYFYCQGSKLHSGPPHYYNFKKYGPRKGEGQYVHNGDSVGVVMDTTKGELSFVLNGVNLGVAYKGIPLDKPLVPCVLLYYKDDSVELTINDKDNIYDRNSEYNRKLWFPRKFSSIFKISLIALIVTLLISLFFGSDL